MFFLLIRLFFSMNCTGVVATISVEEWFKIIWAGGDKIGHFILSCLSFLRKPKPKNTYLCSLT